MDDTMEKGCAPIPKAVGLITRDSRCWWFVSYHTDHSTITRVLRVNFTDTENH